MWLFHEAFKYLVSKTPPLFKNSAKKKICYVWLVVTWSLCKKLKYSENFNLHKLFFELKSLFINISTWKVNYLNQFPLHPILVLFYMCLKTSWFKLQLLTAEGQITKRNPSDLLLHPFHCLKPRGLWMDLPPQQKTSTCPPRADEQRAGHQRDLIGYCFGMFK